MMLDTADNKIYFPRFYDIDTICSYDNSGQLKFDVDIEMEQGYWNTSSSRLWTRIRDLMHNDIVTTYNNMRQNGVSYENMMKYIYDEQIAKIPQTYYNKDYDVKYAPFADSYIGMAHGDTYEHVKRWLKQRFTFVDTLFDYEPSYNNDILTIRANTTELMTLEIETYTPVYLHLSWYNGQMDKKKIDGKASVEFSGKAQAATDQEVLIYGGSNVKSIKGIQSANPNRLILGSATKLTELDASDCPLLAEINMNKANLSPHEYLNKVNLSNCPLLEGNLRLNNSPLVQEINIKGTNITGMNLPSSIRNLQVLRLPNTMTELTLNDAGMLHTLEFDEGVNLQSISMTNCNALENTINFDLLQTPSITLNNSYNNVAELYFKDTTNLSLSNMSNLERVIFTPNNEYETFELINVANAPDYKVTTFNCPKLSTFMTTAPYRESYNDCGMKDVMGTVYETLQTNVALKLSQSSGVDVKTGYFYTTEEGKGDCVSDFDYYKLIAGNSYSFTMKNGSWFRISFYDLNKNFIRCLGDTVNTTSYEDTPTEDCFVRLTCIGTVGTTELNILGNVYIPTEKVVNQIKEYGDIQPNTTFTANSIDISNTQFTDVKLLCTTDTNILKLPTTVKNFYCDSSFDLDTDYLEDGEYDVVHGELVEPYTTDYESEVTRYKIESVMFINDDCTYDARYLDNNGNITVDANYATMDFIQIVQGSTIYSTHGMFKIIEYDANKQMLEMHWDKSSIELKPNCHYIKYSVYKGNNQKVYLDRVVPYVPNLIPSSADGSLIFSMYAPSNTVAPTSGTWDLKGLEFDNFHTFGMNNDVKGAAYYCDYWMNDNIRRLGVIDFKEYQTEPLNISLYPYKSSIEIHLYTSSLEWSSNQKITCGEDCNLLRNFFAIPLDADTEYVVINGVKIFPGDEMTSSQQANPYFSAKSLTMPARYDDYNITIKNANISPKTHNTMLYPLLVNEDNPITGYLNYFFYGGKHLSWSFAYTKGYGHTLTVIQPKDELLNSYEYKYNAFYDTEYEFDNPYEVARYTSSASGVLPSFNAEFTYTYDEIDNGDGTYTTKIYADSLDNLPTGIRFSGKTTLLTVDRLNTSNVTNMSFMFQYCNNLTSLDVSGFDTSKVTNMYSMFYDCKSLTSLDVSGFDTSNVTNMQSMFLSCSKLTSLDLSGFDTSKVTNMSNMFNNCNNLTSLDLSKFDTNEVTDMSGMFSSCNKLTSLNISGFDTSKVTNMYGIFSYCNNLTSLDVSGFDTNSVDNMSYMFNDCNKLTSLDLSEFDTSKVTNMSNMFSGCSGLTSLDLSGFDTKNVTDMSAMFYGCTQLTSLDVSGFDTSNVTSMYYMFHNCSNLTSLDLSGFDTGNVTYMDGMFYNCYNLTSLDLSEFDTGNVITMINMFYNCSNLTSLDLSGFDTKNVTSMGSMFYVCSGLTSLDLSGFDTGNVTNMTHMFNGCSSLTSLDISGFNTSKVTNMDYMFNDCSGLTSLDVSNFNTSKVTGMAGMFQNCNKLTTLDVSGFDTNIVTDMLVMFHACTTLTSLDSMQNISTNLDLSSTILNITSLLDVIDNLATFQNQAFRTLTLGTTLLAKLTEDQIAIAVNKGWTVV